MASRGAAYLGLNSRKPPFHSSANRPSHMNSAASSAGFANAVCRMRTQARRKGDSSVPQLVRTKPGALCMKVMPAFSLLSESNCKGPEHQVSNDSPHHTPKALP